MSDQEKCFGWKLVDQKNQQVAIEPSKLQSLDFDADSRTLNGAITFVTEEDFNSFKLIATVA